MLKSKGNKKGSVGISGAFVICLAILFLNACDDEVVSKIFGESADSVKVVPVVNIAMDELTYDTLKWFANPSLFPMEPEILEASGMAPSFTMPGKFWLHSDDGNTPVLFIHNQTGTQHAQVVLEGIFSFNNEDISSFWDPARQKSTIFLGDIGDNYFVRPYISIYYFEEPHLDEGQDYTISDCESLFLEFPRDSSGVHQAFNCEAFFVDPLTKEVYIFTKADSVSHVFKSDHFYHEKFTSVLQPVLTLKINGERVTAADISIDGSLILLKTYNYIMQWERKADQSIEEALKQKPVLLPYKAEPQGEAVCWSLDKAQYFTTSEIVRGEQQVIRAYTLK